MRRLRNIRHLLLSTLPVLLPALAQAQSNLGTGELRIAGVQLVIAPATQTVPRNQATGLTVTLEDPAHPGQPLTALSPALLATFRVKGELSGPGFAQPEELSVTFGASPTALLPIPPLLTTGNYVVDNLRLENASGQFILPGEPAVAALNVIERVIVTSVSSRPLSLEEIQERGIVIDESNFTAYEFTFGIATESGQVPISLDVAFPQDPDVIDGTGGLGLPAILPSLDVPNLEVKGLILERVGLGDETISIPPIPAVVVIPGNIAFLNQFFQVIVLVSNVAPAGSRLVVTSATADLELPVGNDLVPESSDDPLAAAEYPGAPVPVNGVLTGAIRNTSDGTPAFGPGSDANAEFVVEGRKEGTHRLHVTINAELQGLPIGPVPLKGTAIGTVFARIAHQLPTAVADTPASQGRTPSGLLDIVSTMPASTSARAALIYGRLCALATESGERFGLVRNARFSLTFHHPTSCASGWNWRPDAPRDRRPRQRAGASEHQSLARLGPARRRRILEP